MHYYVRAPLVAPASGRGGPEPKKALLNIRRAIEFRRPGRLTALRAVAHLAAWLPFVLGPARIIRHGWRPVGDEAAIALRSWNSLTAHGPLVGQATRLAHGVFDPGPLEYWLLAIPVHLDTVHGVLWGAIICCLVACSLAVEAAWSVLGAAGGLCASGFIVGVTLWMPVIAVTPSWNPWFGLTFFIAALAAAWAVMSGHRGWWPALVISASIAAQSHLMFTVPSGALAILALIVGLVDTIRSRAGSRWVVAGLIAGAACWSGPLIQQFTSRNGNLGLLLRSSGATSGARTGGAFSLRALSAATEPVPIWLKPSMHPLAIYRLINHRPAWFAVAVLVLLAVAAVMAVRPLRCRPLGALAVVSLVISLGSLVTYSSIPVHHTSLNTLIYLIVLLFPVGVLSWLVVGGWAVLTARLVIRQLTSARPAGRLVAQAARERPRPAARPPAPRRPAPGRPRGHRAGRGGRDPGHSSAGTHGPRGDRRPGHAHVVGRLPADRPGPARPADRPVGPRLQEVRPRAAEPRPDLGPDPGRLPRGAHAHPAGPRAREPLRVPRRGDPAGQSPGPAARHLGRRDQAGPARQPAVGISHPRHRPPAAAGS